MPAKSKAQQKAAGAALAAKRGEQKVSELKDASKSMYDSMSEKEREDLAAAGRLEATRPDPGRGITLGQFAQRAAGLCSAGDDGVGRREVRLANAFMRGEGDVPPLQAATPPRLWLEPRRQPHWPRRLHCHPGSPDPR